MGVSTLWISLRISKNLPLTNQDLNIQYVINSCPIQYCKENKNSKSNEHFVTRKYLIFYPFKDYSLIVGHHLDNKTYLPIPIYTVHY